MRRQDFSFELPERLIAQHPLPERSASRLLVLDPDKRNGGPVSHRQFTELASLLAPGDHLVFNDTRVIAARLSGEKSTGGKLEMLVERVLDSTRMLAKVRASRSPKVGATLSFDGIAAKVLARHDDLFELGFELAPGQSLDGVLEEQGCLPLPPYIQRPPEAEDLERYQTIYAREAGAVAAPTAGLHFDEGVFAALANRGISHSFVTLHVGAGTFAPVREDDIAEHRIHAERVSVSAATVSAIESARAAGGRIIAVGTTSVRSLEAAAEGGRLQSFDGLTQLYLRPGSTFRVIDGMITNFHLPESTLLMLVTAFAGFEVTLAAYREAVAQEYRFFSYGDAMLVWPAKVLGDSA